MRTLVVLAVIGVCSASYQAYNHGYGHYGGSYGYYQPKWTGPVAATVPAGVGGKIIPVSDTYEVAAARDAFFKLYQKQLAAVGGHRYGTPGYAHAGHAFVPAVHAHYGAPAHHGAPAHYGAHAHYGVHGAPTQVGDTPEVAAAKAQFFKLYNKQAAAAAAAPDHYTYYHSLAPHLTHTHTAIMRTLVVLAVIGVCSASYQAYNHGYGHYGGHYGYYQPKWTGPVAATVPAGVGGKIIPVSDTYEVAAARDAFFKLYQKQLAAVGAHRYGTPGYAHVPAVHAHYGAPAHYGAHTLYGAHGAPTQVGDTPEVAAAKAQFFKLYNLQAAAAAAAPDHYTYY
ncbi:uncharacterized protein [Panulirus ornatus]|uniref:uncharacterized protein n=1 Tax=Panulirus ornatus TaxID=150431 RepID=UPI003A86CC4D